MYGRRTVLTAAVLLGALSLLQGCVSAPDRPTVADVTIRGARQVSASDVSAHLATRADATFLGFHLQYEVYDHFVVERDVARLERYYRARGFHEVRVTAGRAIELPSGKIAVEFVVDEGAPTIVSVVRVERMGEVSTAAGHALASAQLLSPGDRFDEDKLAQMKAKMLSALTDAGYAHARIEGGFAEADLAPDGGNAVPLDPFKDIDRAREAAEKHEASKVGETLPDGTKAPPRKLAVRVDAVLHTAEIFLKVDPGPLCRFGDITINDLGELPEGQVRATIGIRRGRRYSTEALESARHALLELGVFSSVEYIPTLPADRSSEIPIAFKLARAPLHTITLGGGVQADVLQTDTHFLAGYEHQNFLGGLRRLTMQARPGVVLFPTNLQNLLPPENPFFQMKSRAELRQPQFLEARTRGTIRSEFLVYPVLLAARSRAEVPDAVVGYYEVREAAGVERSFFRGKLALSLFYNLQLSFPFAYKGDEDLQNVFISHLSFTQALDFRDNPVKPRKGVYFANEIQLAGGALQGDADDVRVQPDLRLYAPVATKITAAMRGSIGFLFPRSYGSTLSQSAPTTAGDDTAFEEQRNRDLQLLFFRAFFSGGPSSNRGYPLRGVGPRGLAPFAIGSGGRAVRECVGRVPGGTGVKGAASQFAALPPVNQETLEALCFVPLGGLSLWEWSLELRFQLTEHLSTLVFLDASDVTRERFTLRLNYPHLSTGSGLRYDTPVGPVRLDVGYAIPGLQQIGSTLSPTEGQAASVFGLPIAVNIAVGEAF